MDDWDYCVNTLPKVSRTFALNISVLKGELHRSILTAYLFCRTIDTIEDASRLDPRIKIKLLLEFARLIQDSDYRKKALDPWIKDCAVVDGTPNDLDLLAQNHRAFNIFDQLKEMHQAQIIPSVCRMAQGMAYYQKRFDFNRLTLLENENELEEYCYFVAGTVGEMLCNLFLTELPGLPDPARQTLRNTAVSFGLGLQMTNISKDMIVDQSRGWSYIPKSYITESGSTVEEFTSGAGTQTHLRILERLLLKTTGHLRDALKFTLALPRRETALRLFCIWPLWMAMETVAVLHNNIDLFQSDAPVKISRATVKKILLKTRLMAFSDVLLKRSFDRILKPGELENPPSFDLAGLKQRLDQIPLDSITNNTQPA